MIAPFTTDGCSGQIYRTIFRREPPWNSCCVEHDREYWQGGTKEQRAQADAWLMLCVYRKGHPIIAVIMHIAVRIGGHPLLPTPWRWGYGYPWPSWYGERPKDDPEIRASG